ncbi:hypothetical protein ABZ436_20330 [Micromonospora matsumotoense]|uniref:hypothetical protein n=1 Tax=Micromonospora matsumotoense TaxID=121616 RepID=UPI0033E7F3B3
MYEGRPEPPFRVLMAGYVVDFHHRNACTRCRPDGSCHRLTAAAETIRAWRDRPDRPLSHHAAPDPGAGERQRPAAP